MIEIELDEVKTFLGITSNDDDLRLQAILDSVLDQAEKIIWDISNWTKKQFVKNTSVKNETFTLNIINATKLLKVNGIDYSLKVSWVDYLINTDNNIIVKWIYWDISNDFWFFEVEYTAGFSTLPKSFIWIISTYCWILYAKDLWKDVVSEKLGPRWVDYLNIGIEKAENIFIAWLSQFIPLALKIY